MGGWRRRAPGMELRLGGELREECKLVQAPAMKPCYCSSGECADDAYPGGRGENQSFFQTQGAVSPCRGSRRDRNDWRCCCDGGLQSKLFADSETNPGHSERGRPLRRRARMVLFSQRQRHDNVHVRREPGPQGPRLQIKESRVQRARGRGRGVGAPAT